MEDSQKYYDHEGKSFYYKDGLTLHAGSGNNAFSLDRKSERDDLKVTPLRSGYIEDLKIGEHVAFQDFDGEEWLECSGLEYSVLSLQSGIPIYVFDNHNHAFYGWAEGMKSDAFKKGATLVHLDAHFDDTQPVHVDVDLNDLEDVWKYTNETLQIASFIKPALELGTFSNVLNYVESSNFTQLPDLKPDQEVILDIDLDVFCDEMSHVSWSEKLNVIRHFLPNTKLVTMATSPFFIDQQRAIDIAKRLLDEVFIQT
jgi:hypothetical protein